MPKIITDKELAAIVTRVINNDEIDDYDQYRNFLEHLAGLLTKHLGGISGIAEPSPDEDSKEWYVPVYHDECVPEDGGIWKDYDQDNSVEDWREDSLVDGEFN